MDMILFLTRDCTLECPYCYVEHKSDSSMSAEIAFKAVDLFISENSEKGKLSFFGGEPLLQFELVKKLTKYADEEARKKGFDVNFSIATNGTLVDDEVLGFFEEYSFRVELSLDETKGLTI